MPDPGFGNLLYPRLDDGFDDLPWGLNSSRNDHKRDETEVADSRG